MTLLALSRSRIALTLAPLALAACLDGTPPPADDDVGEAEATAALGSDLTPEPLPSPFDIIQPAAVFSVNPGTRPCYNELSANQSAGIGGYFQYFNFVKYPKLVVFWRRNTQSSQSKIYAGDIVPDATGFYQKVFNTSNGNASLFPGLFQFCLRNPGANPGPFQSNATVVTF